MPFWGALIVTVVLFLGLPLSWRLLPAAGSHVALAAVVREQAQDEQLPALAVAPTAWELEVVRLVNQERVKAGLWPLAVSSALTQAARAHNADMITNNFFGHYSSDGRDPGQRAADAGFRQYGWGAAFVGENIAGGYLSPQAVVEGWLNSAGHRANILNPDYREIGVGYTEDPKCQLFCNFWTQDFGSQPLVLPVFINDGAEQAYGSTVKVTLTDETVSSWGSIGPVREMMLANDPGFVGATWQPYARYTYWHLPAGSGSRAVYARLRDGEGKAVESSVAVTVVQVDYKYKTYLPLGLRQ